MEELKSVVFQVAEAERPMTLRGLFYRMTTLGWLEKSEAEYKALGRFVTQMRDEGYLPHSWLVDSTRWQRKPRTHVSLERMLQDQQRLYRRALWAEQEAYCEIWIEKDALAGVVYDVTERYDVPLMTCRGYPSRTFLYGAAEAIACEGKPTFIYYFGDHDPSGRDISRYVEEQLYKYTEDEGCDIEFERVAVNEEQIEEWKLPTRPTKTTDSRSKHFKGESVELDAIPPEQLRELVERCIVQHIDQDVLARTKAVEEAERETLGNLVVQLGGQH